MIKISDADVHAAHAAFFAADGYGHEAILAALEKVAAMHPEWTVVRPLTEPVTDEEADKFIADYNDTVDEVTNLGQTLAVARTAMKLAITKFLKGRAEPEQLAVTDDMVETCMRDIGWLGREDKPAIREVMRWLADHMNNRHNKPVDPRVKIVMDWWRSEAIELSDEKKLAEHSARLLELLDQTTAPNKKTER